MWCDMLRFCKLPVFPSSNMKIDFAPVGVPLHRRLQTVAVLQWVFSFLALAPTCIFLFIYLLFTRYWLISVLYSIWWFFDYDTPARGGRRMSCLCGIKVWDYMRDYFPIKVRCRMLLLMIRHVFKQSSGSIFWVSFTLSISEQITLDLSNLISHQEVSLTMSLLASDVPFIPVDCVCVSNTSENQYLSIYNKYIILAGDLDF
ncbi:diacylglycerol O-acyltransferase 2-like [Hippocampus comes]|uniref:diacylglycerol O-acyltransferase 2-like n=1 Tax=Hippocampus comes TaxID=109280 RepID=UPI00094EA072|nr:PREDICTED: diacylglycerol O-acyltransferase 2-like [Hippocampus comes]